MKRHFTLIFTAVVGIILMSSCKKIENKPKDTISLLTAHKWQLVDESGWNLPKESLGNNIIELKNDGGLVYYDNKEGSNDIFLVNKWSLSSDKKRIIETLPDDSKTETEIVEVTDNTLRIRYKDANHLGEPMTIEETYQKFKKQ